MDEEFNAQVWQLGSFDDFRVTADQVKDEGGLYFGSEYIEECRLNIDNILADLVVFRRRDIQRARHRVTDEEFGLLNRLSSLVNDGNGCGHRVKAWSLVESVRQSFHISHAHDLGRNRRGCEGIVEAASVSQSERDVGWCGLWIIHEFSFNSQ